MHRFLNSQPIDTFITSTQKEYDSIVGEQYKFSKEEVVLTGFSRHDILLEKMNNYKYNNHKKTILIIPTWRKNLVGGINKLSHSRKFNKLTLHSEYIERWSSLLLSKNLHDIRIKYNLILNFFHIKIWNHIPKVFFFWWKSPP